MTPRSRSDSRLRRSQGRLGGMLVIAAALLSVPSSLLLDPLPPLSAYLVVLGAVLTGLVCLGMPWERLSHRWLHAACILASLEVALAAAVFARVYSILFFVVVVFASYVFQTRREIALQVAFVTLALLAPILYDSQHAREAALLAVLAAPVLALTAAALIYLRERLEFSQGSYRRFAAETETLTSRIRSSVARASVWGDQPGPSRSRRSAEGDSEPAPSLPRRGTSTSSRE